MPAVKSNFNPVTDINTIKQQLLESVRISSSIIRSSSYGDLNVKTFSHNLFAQVYDYPYLSASANYLMSVSSGNPTSFQSSATDVVNKAKIYDQFSFLCFGTDATGTIIPMNRYGSLLPATTDYMNQPFFLDFSRLVSKDGIKKGTFKIQLSSEVAYAWTSSAGILYQDFASETGGFKTNSPLGEYGILYTGSATSGRERGLIFYKQGLVVLDGGAIFSASGDMGSTYQFYSSSAGGALTYLSATLTQTLVQGARNLKDRIMYTAFSSSTNLFSTIYTCRLDSQNFFHSTNPTFLSSSGQIRTMKIGPQGNAVPGNSPTTFATTIGLYSANNELLAVAKLSEPFRVSEQTTPGVSFAVRLDY